MSRDHFIRRLHLDSGEVGLRLTGVALAVGSCAFAAHMISDTDRQPEFSGLEHLAIFSKPSNQTLRRNQTMIATTEERGTGIDYTPIGSTQGNAGDALKDYEVLFASGEAALIRTPQGAVLRVAPNDAVSGIGRIIAIERRGDRWAAVTTKGRIWQK